MQWSHWFAGMMDTKPARSDVQLLPLYHSVGGVVATFATLVNGGAVVIRPRFSASDFWRDVRDERCTLFQYIGELCRYLVNTPPQPDRNRTLPADGLRQRAAAGGLGAVPDRVSRFPESSNITHPPKEIFRSTTARGSRAPSAAYRPFLANRLPVALLRFDVEKSEPWRNAEGFCERCAANEIGEAVGLMPATGGERAGRFEGYADQEASERKVLRNVFKAGDSWYRTGDLMRRDERGFYYFVDRVGETYRWKGENVSTAEVLTALDREPRRRSKAWCTGSACRAPMAARAPRRWWSMRILISPRFARKSPRACRLMRGRCFCGYSRRSRPRAHSSRASRSSCRPDLIPSRVTDPLYFDDARSQRYVPVDAALYAAISDGTIRI